MPENAWGVDEENVNKWLKRHRQIKKQNKRSRK